MSATKNLQDPPPSFSVEQDEVPAVSPVEATGKVPSPTNNQASESSSSSSSSSSFTAESDISNPNRRIWVVTTAAMPWRTGTAVNPLMRALALTRGRPRHHVTLLVPWLEDVESRNALYGDAAFASADEGGKEAQEEWIRNFCRTRAKSPEEEANLRIQFWDGVYHESFGSIFPSVDICSLIPVAQADVAILEEPEHLNWFRAPPKLANEKQGGANENVEVLGWARKFKFVVGVLHTNYDSYVKKYGMGTSLITAPALNALSSLVVKAYCHRVIRLSDTLPSLVARKEVTANVHGVRAEFLDPPKSRSSEAGCTADTTTENGNYASVYYIGKLIWAKGFEDVLELQELYRSAKGEYFEMDIYGGGNDQKAIKRAFFGRNGHYHRADSASSTTSSLSNEEDKAAADIFDRDESLLSLLNERSRSEDSNDDDERTQEDKQSEEEKKDDSPSSSSSSPAPMDVLGDFSKRTLGTGAETAGAAMQLIESVMQHGFGACSQTTREDITLFSSSSKNNWRQGALKLGPRIAAFKWRKNPVPARFLGVMDHIAVRDIAQHSIFLNMSTSEVLCTTSAEALAMGKHVILPKHPSNEFFYQFPNCLAYDSLDDCVEKLLYAQANQPSPLSEEHRYMLSWEGATERLYQASGVPESVAAANRRYEKEEIKAARFHVETARRSQFVARLFKGRF